MKKYIILITVLALPAATGILIHQTRQAPGLTSQIDPLQSCLATAGGRPDTADAANRAESERQLQDQVATLTAALSQARSNNIQLEVQRRLAQHDLELFKEMQEKINPTNMYPTPRHLAAGLGRMIAQAADLDNKDLTDEQKVEMAAAMLGDMTKLAQAASKLKNQEGGFNPPNSVDSATCLLYGALGLNEQQFGQTTAILQKYQDQAREQGLLQDQLPRDLQPALDRINLDAMAEVRQLLSEEQSSTFQKVFQNTNFNMLQGGLIGGAVKLP